MKRKRLFQNLSLLLVTSAICLGIGEIVLRWMLYNQSPNFENWRNPAHYASPDDPNYWKLLQQWKGQSRPPASPHPFLGWTGKYFGDTYLHHEFGKLGKKRPVLLYGDSFSMCVEQVECFEDILNVDSTFSKDHFLLNYGVGGYGVDQAALLMSQTMPRYEKPFVVFGLLTTDMERSIMPYRDGQKPYLDEEDGELLLKGLPIKAKTQDYLDENPVAIGSYLFKRWASSRFNPSHSLKHSIFGETRRKALQQKVNRLLLKQVCTELRARDIDFTFLVFHYEENMWNPEYVDWRDEHLREVMAELKAPCIFSIDVLRKHREQHPELGHYDYVLPTDGHPTTLYNSLIAAEIKRLALTSQPQKGHFTQTNTFEAMASKIESDILASENWRKAVAEKALENGMSFETQLQVDAAYTLQEFLAKHALPLPVMQSSPH